MCPAGVSGGVPWRERWEAFSWLMLADSAHVGGRGLLCLKRGFPHRPFPSPAVSPRRSTEHDKVAGVKPGSRCRFPMASTFPPPSVDEAGGGNPCCPKTVPGRCLASVLPSAFARISFPSACFLCLDFLADARQRRGEAGPPTLTSAGCRTRPGQGRGVTLLTLLPLPVFFTQVEGLRNVLFLHNVGISKKKKKRTQGGRSRP